LLEDDAFHVAIINKGHTLIKLGLFEDAIIEYIKLPEYDQSPYFRAAQTKPEELAKSLSAKDLLCKANVYQPFLNNTN